MTTAIKVNPVHAVHVEIRGEEETISHILETGSAETVFYIWGTKVMTIKEIDNAPIVTSAFSNTATNH